MNWTNYFIALGLPVIWVFLTFVLAVGFHNSRPLTKLFFFSFVGGLIFSLFWVPFGIVVAIVEGING